MTEVHVTDGTTMQASDDELQLIRDVRSLAFHIAFIADGMPRAQRRQFVSTEIASYRQMCTEAVGTTFGVAVAATLRHRARMLAIR